jgi:hypothetical protein
MSIDGPDGPKGTSKPRPNSRGVFEKVRGSGVYWVRYTDAAGKLHREKVGPKSLARKIYELFKTEICQGRFFPAQRGRRDAALAAVIDDFLNRIKGQRRSYRDFVRNGQTWKLAFPNHTLGSISPGDIERQIARVNKKLPWLPPR